MLGNGRLIASGTRQKLTKRSNCQTADFCIVVIAHVIGLETHLMHQTSATPIHSLNRGALKADIMTLNTPFLVLSNRRLTVV